MITIKKIAEEIGVSKQAIRNAINDLKLQSSLQKNGNYFAINEKQEKLIKSHFSNKIEKQTKSENTANEKLLQSTFRLLEKQNDQLNRELEIKNKQIEDLSTALVEAQQTAKAAQMLHAGTIQQQLSDNVNIMDKESMEEKKPSFFERLFGKNK